MVIDMVVFVDAVAVVFVDAVFSGQGDQLVARGILSLVVGVDFRQGGLLFLSCVVRSCALVFLEDCLSRGWRRYFGVLVLY